MCRTLVLSFRCLRVCVQPLGTALSTHHSPPCAACTVSKLIPPRRSGPGGSQRGAQTTTQQFTGQRLFGGGSSGASPCTACVFVPEHTYFPRQCVCWCGVQKKNHCPCTLRLLVPPLQWLFDSVEHLEWQDMEQYSVNPASHLPPSAL